MSARWQKYWKENLNMGIKTVGVIGLGLIGGSLAKALRRVKGIKEIIGVDNNDKVLEIALKEGVLNKASLNIDESLKEADVVFICSPVSTIIDCINMLSKVVKPGCILTDTGSIKNQIINYVESIHDDIDFIGGHPMCGSEKYGYQASKAHLFENAYHILTPCSKTAEETTAKMEKIFIEIGAIPVIIDSRKHDVITGAISHVPHVISAILVNLIKDMDYQEGFMKTLAAGGFKDITRISSSKPEMWQSVVLRNKNNVLRILDEFSEKVNEFRNYLKDNSKEDIHRVFSSAKEYRDGFTSGSVGLIAPFHDLTVDIEDKPGEIARITTLLSQDGINIKNINIFNNREHEAGCMKITLSSMDGIEKAYNILNTSGYMVYRD
jgi:prephenate dehydrogenase